MAQVGEMSAVEVDWWMIRASIEPLTAKRLEMYLAYIAMWIHNTNAKKAKPLKDFILFNPEKSKKIDDQIMDVFSKLVPAQAKK